MRTSDKPTVRNDTNIVKVFGYVDIKKIMRKKKSDDLTEILFIIPVCSGRIFGPFRSICALRFGSLSAEKKQYPFQEIRLVLVEMYQISSQRRTLPDP